MGRLSVSMCIYCVYWHKQECPKGGEQRWGCEKYKEK